ncbi:MAG: sugar ABC transporter ATP-binding protein [Armatimonadota bacterium]|nr:sugar ABC transporter ATP-binding protein [Armatimonadota bacterium]
MPASVQIPLLEMRGITKRFPGVLALDNVDLVLHRGEILGLIGENGAGKSTLMRILAGDYPADSGAIYLDGRPVSIKGVRDAIELGISVIYQELNLAPNLDVASNIFLGREPRKKLLGIVDKRALYSRASELAERVGLSGNVTTPVSELSPGGQQLVEIAKALSVKSRILVLDEPTSSLTPSEVSKLFDIMRKLRATGVSMIFVSHRLAEVKEICERVVVLRDGRNAGELDKPRMEIEEMVKLMVGRDLARFFPKHGQLEKREVVLSVRGLRPKGAKSEISFDLHSGEVLGVAGLVGAGRTELVRSLFGVDPPEAGSVEVKGRATKVRSPSDAIKLGMGLVPEDRKQLGVILEMNVAENISLPSIKTYHPVLLDRKRELQTAQQVVDSLDIRTPSLFQRVQYLSGGNQQKVALGKWLALSPRILILDEPTRGIDVGSKSEIYKLIRNLANDGVGIIMVSSELEEIIGLSDRVLVMHEGRCTGILDGDQITEENIVRLATGS